MKQKLKSEHTRDIILKSAFESFFEKGFQATSIDQIMDRTALSKGAFYHHFKNKKELGELIISTTVKDRIYKQMILPLFNDDSPKLLLKTVFINKVKTLSDFEKTHGCPANSLINEIGNKESVYQSALKRIIEEWKSALAAVIERGKYLGQFKSTTNSESMALYLISAFEGFRGINTLYLDDYAINHYIIAIETTIDNL